MTTDTHTEKLGLGGGCKHSAGVAPTNPKQQPGTSVLLLSSTLGGGGGLAGFHRREFSRDK